MLSRRSNSFSWIFSLGIHLGMLGLVGLLLLAKRSDHDVFSVSLEPISSQAIPRQSVRAGPKNTEHSLNGTAVAEPAQAPPVGRTGIGVLTPKEQYLLELKNFFQNQLVYPATSQANREKGRVEVSFTIDRAGIISQVTLEKPSDYPRLNRAAIELVETAHRFRAFPMSVTEDSLRLAIPIDYGI